jgi:hypothetical protein
MLLLFSDIQMLQRFQTIYYIMTVTDFSFMIGQG